MSIYGKLTLAFLPIALFTFSGLAQPPNQCEQVFENSDSEEDLWDQNKGTHPDQRRQDLVLKWLKQSLAEDPDDLHDQQTAASLCMKLSRFDEAIYHSQEVIRLEGPTPNNLEKLMSVYLQIPRPDKVREIFEFALEHSLVNSRLVRQVARSAGEREEKLKTIELIDRWLEKACPADLLLKLKVKLLLPLGRYDEAMAILSGQLKARPKDPYLLSLKSQVLRAEHRYDESLQVAGQVLECDPLNLLAYCMKTESLMGLARYQDAISFVEEGIAESPHTFQSRGVDIYNFKMKFWILMVQGFYRQALEYVQSQKDWEVNQKLGLALQVEALLLLNRNKEAAQLSLKSIDEFHENALTLSRVAQAMLGLGERAAAHAALNRALEISPSSLRSIILKALLYTQENEPDKALDVLTQVERRYPAQIAAIQVYFLARFGRLDQAQQKLESLSHLQSRKDLLPAASAYFHLRAQEYEKAKAISHLILTEDPDHRLGQIVRAQVSLGLKDYDTVFRYHIRKHQGRDAVLNSTIQGQATEALENPDRQMVLLSAVDDEILFSLMFLTDRVY